MRWAERIGVPAMERGRKRERWSDGRLEGKNGCSRPPCSDPLSSFNSFSAEWLLSLYFYTPSINRPPQTHLCSLTKWHIDTHTHIYICTKTHTITDVDNDRSPAKPLWVIKCVWVYALCALYEFVCALCNLFQALQITCCPAVWPDHEGSSLALTQVWKCSSSLCFIFLRICHKWGDFFFFLHFIQTLINSLENSNGDNKKTITAHRIPRLLLSGEKLFISLPNTSVSLFYRQKYFIKAKKGIISN